MPKRDPTTAKGTVLPKAAVCTSSERDAGQQAEREMIKPPLTPSLHPEIAARIDLINGAMDEYLSTDSGEPALLYQAAHHLIAAGGKRLRSLLILLCCEAVGGTAKDVLPIAVATELIQTASLIRDDMMDRDEFRRGVMTVHRKFGEDIAMLAADLLVAQAVRMVGQHGRPEVLEHAGLAGVRMCEGETLDLLIEREGMFSEEQYMNTVKRKTAAFMEAAAKIGSCIGKGTQSQQDALSRYAATLGIAFQIRDDILDVTSTQEATGTSVRSDLRWVRSNLPLIHALAVSPQKKRETCQRKLSEGDVEEAMHLIEKTESIEYASMTARNYVEQGKAALEGQGFPNERLLRCFADLVSEREY